MAFFSFVSRENTNQRPLSCGPQPVSKCPGDDVGCLSNFAFLPADRVHYFRWDLLETRGPKRKQIFVVITGQNEIKRTYDLWTVDKDSNFMSC
ncbi:hypothetical protein CDAR_58491 [Caerostris darwini]|uniref:Uncharacterized protein n=1 Tax=Caerostris darwini TaxID=1538125 RepID=A0AAV4U7D4_9ARAC|nr:hypothetical protein CDAR_58491 [Caerostris darwini]